jgi:hypothetical protein
MLLHCNNIGGFGQVVIVMMGVEGRHMEKVMFARPLVSTEIHVNTTEAIFTMSGMSATSLESTQSIDFTSYSQEQHNGEHQTYDVGQTLIVHKLRHGPQIFQICRSHLKILGVKETLMAIKLSQGPQIFQICRSHLKILGAKETLNAIKLSQCPQIFQICRSHLKILDAKETLMAIKLSQCPQIFRTRRSHLKILGTRRVIRSKFHSENTEILGVIVRNLVVWRRGARDLSTAELSS